MKVHDIAKGAFLSSEAIYKEEKVGAKAEKKTDEIAICILTMGPGDILSRLLQSMIPELVRYSGTTHVYVLNQTSNRVVTEVTKRFALKIPGAFTAVRSLANLGCSGGRKFLTDIAFPTSEAFVYLDDDCECEGTGWLDALIDPLSAYGIVGVDGRQITPDYQTRVDAGYDYVSGGRCAVSKSVFSSGVQFDPQYMNYWEDADLCMQAKSHHFKIKAIENPGILHGPHPGNAEVMLESRSKFMAKWDYETIRALRG